MISDKQKRYLQFFMDCVDSSAKMSYSRRSKVGALLVKDNRIIVNSWNGTPSGASDNNCEELIDGELVTKSTVIHAEANALMFAAKNGICTKDTDLYVSLSPCANCALLIIQSGIRRVFFKETYRNTEGLKILKQHAIEVFKVSLNYELSTDDF